MAPAGTADQVTAPAVPRRAWQPGSGFRTVDDPRGQGTITVNGVNDAGDLVGFYTDSAGNTDRLHALPRG